MNAKHFLLVALTVLLAPHLIHGMDTPRPASELSEEPGFTLKGHVGRVNSTVFSPDGSRLVTVGEDGLLKVWDTKLGKEVHSVAWRIGPAQQVTVSHDGRYMATASHSLGAGMSFIRIWDGVGGPKARTLNYSGSIGALSFSPNGGLLAAASFNNTARIWNTRDWKPQSTLIGHRFAVQSVAFAPDGRTLAVGAWDGTVTLHDSVKWKPVRLLLGPEEPREKGRIIRSSIYSLS